MLGSLLSRVGEVDGDVLVDCGRLDLGSPALAIWDRADRQVMVVRPRLADLQALISWLEGRSFDGRPALVTVGDGPYPDAEIAESLGVEVLARLPWNPDAAEGLLSVPASARPLRLAPLVRAVRTLADQLVGGRAETTPAEVGTAGETGPAGRAIAVRSRVLRVWRSDTKPATNGSVAEEVGR
jgi:hypothetical protein